MKKKILYIAEAFGGGVFTYFTELANAVAEEYEVLSLMRKEQRHRKILNVFSAQISVSWRFCIFKEA